MGKGFAIVRFIFRFDSGGEAFPLAWRAGQRPIPAASFAEPA